MQVLGLSISVTLKCCFSRSFSRGQMPCYSFLLLHLSIWGHGFMNVRSVQNATRSLESKPALHSPIACRSAALVSFLFFFFFPFTTTLPERALTGKFISVNKIQALKIWKQVRCFACTSLPQKKKIYSSFTEDSLCKLNITSVLMKQNWQSQYVFSSGNKQQKSCFQNPFQF